MSTQTGHDHAELAPPRLEEVAEGVHAYVQPDGTWWINNCGVLAGDDGVVLIDTCATERRTRALLDSVRRLSPAPARTLVNTHHHGDHTHGNHLVAGATIVGHERCREAMIATGINHYEQVWPGVDWGDVRLAPPSLTFADRIDLWVDDRRVELHYIGGPAHTTNDVVVWLPDRSVLFSGDLVFNGGTPFVLMGSVTGALAATERLRSFPATTIVPGHGAVCGPSVLDRLEAYYRFVLRTAEEGRAAGLPPLEAARSADLGEFADLTDSERLVGNLHRAYHELAGAEPGSPFDLTAAIGDMLQYAGGPLRCLA